MSLRDLSIRVKVVLTILGALLVVLGVATTVSLRYWEQEQFSLTNDHALMMASGARSSIEAALAHGQVGWVRGQLDTMATRPPFAGYRVVAVDGRILLSSRDSEEGQSRSGPALPGAWDIPPGGQVVGGRGQAL